MTSPLVSAAELAELLRSGRPPRILDVRWRLGQSDGREQYLAGHLPGAVFVDLEGELSRHGAPEEGRHPLPGMVDFQEAARRWGLGDGDEVVVYDDASSLAAGRAWWMLHQLGVKVRVLDGGLGAWKASGGAIEGGDVVPAPGSIALSGDFGGIGIDDAAAWPEHGALLDVRAAERFRGETEPLDPAAGHIPGARNLPAANYTTPEGSFRSPEEIRAAFASVAGDAPIAAYCGSGVTAAQAALAGEIAGIPVRVFPGSWSAWSNTPGRPVVTGD